MHRTSIAFSPDGKKVAWVCHQPDRAPNDGGGLTIHLWELEKRYPLNEMKAATDFTYAYSPLRFTPNGRMLVVGCWQMTTEQEELAKPSTVVRNNVRVWLVASGKELPFAQREDGRTEAMWQAVAVTPNGKSIVGVNGKGGRVWKVPEGTVVRRFTLEPAIRLVLSSDGKLAAGTAKDNSVRVWSTEDSKETIELLSGRALGFSADNKQLATLHDEKVCLWDVHTGKQLWSIPGKLGKDELQGPRFDFSPAGNRLAWNEDGKITVVDAATGKVVTTIGGEPGPLAFSPDGRRLAVACPDGTVLVWELGKSDLE